VSVLVTVMFGCRKISLTNTVVFSSSMMLKVVVRFSKVTLTILVKIVLFGKALFTLTVMLRVVVWPLDRLPRDQVVFSTDGRGVLLTNVVFSGKNSVTVMLVALPSPVLLMSIV